MGSYGRSKDRFRPNSPQRRRGRKEPSRIGDLIAGVVRKNGLGNQSTLDRLRSVWQEAVGRKNAAETRIMGLQRGVLTVEVASAALAQELGVYYKRELLKRLREQAGVPIEDLRCRVSGRIQGSPNEQK